MGRESAVEFETNSRIHMALAVHNLERSAAFYRTLFGREPTKTRPRFARFEAADPPVNLALNEVGGETGPNHPVAHFGVQVKSVDAVSAVATRLERAGVALDREDRVTCCYAMQTKVWATDPDGNRWEVYVVLDDQGTQYHPSAGADLSTDACCSPNDVSGSRQTVCCSTQNQDPCCSESYATPAARSTA
jgi:catechol 2,3-dioxygenase-like lactoylglutathione lyase family enzyme